MKKVQNIAKCDTKTQREQMLLGKCCSTQGCWVGAEIEPSCEFCCCEMNGGKSGNSCLKKRTQERGWQGRVLALIGVGWTGKKKETVGDISVSPPASTRLGLLRMW